MGKGTAEIIGGAFGIDCFDVEHKVEHEGKTGIRAVHRSACIGGDQNKKKKAYYIEGSPRQMGFLMGLIAEPEIERMCTEFRDNVLADFLSLDTKNSLHNILKGFLNELALTLSKNAIPDIPDQYKEELEGMLEGCKKVKPGTKVTMDYLWVLNVGFDAILSFVYTFKLPLGMLVPFGGLHTHFRIPLMCNGFSAYGSSPQPYHYMGRDFMFATGDVFQETAAMIVCKPDGGIPFVSQTAPGIIGSMTGLNCKGLGIGVQMAAAGNCNPSRPGFNSLLLNRHIVQNAHDFNEAKDLMTKAQRGVSWIYIIADGTNDMACVVEAGEKSNSSYNDGLPAIIPDDVYDSKLFSKVQLDGLIIRPNGHQFFEELHPDDFSSFNKSLIENFKADKAAYGYDNYNYSYADADFGPNGFIDKTLTDRNCPMSLYFPPARREGRSNFVAATNHFLTPEMRLYQMWLFPNVISQSHCDDIQWRYDQLIKLLKAAIDTGEIYEKEKVRKIISFLSPTGACPDYYSKAKNPNLIQGSISLLDLKARTIECHYGYFSDEWVTISIDNYK